MMGFSDIEAIVYEWLTKRGIPFSFQVPFFGGRFSLGGAVIDFVLDNGLLWRIQGEYYHTGVKKEGTDAVQRELLESEGFTVIDLWSSDIEDRTEETLSKALLGQEMLH